MNSRDWPQVPLGEVLTQSAETIDILPDRTYQEVTVRLWGRGVVLRRRAEGAEMAAQRRSIVHTGQLLLSRIDARNGAIGLVPADLDGAVVSNDFPSFDLNQGRLLPAYVGWLSKTGDFVDKCKAASEGTTNRVRLDVSRFLGLPIPLPPLPEQRRIVARIEELAGKVAAANETKRSSATESDFVMDAQVGAALARLEGTPAAPLGSLTSKIGSGSTPKGGRAAYPDAGVPFIRSMNVRMRKFQWDDIAFIDPVTHATMSGTHVRPRDVLLNITGASIGRVACAPDDLGEGNVNQHVAIIRTVEPLSARFLMYWLSQPNIQTLINDEQKGATRQGFTKAQIEKLRIPVPPVRQQLDAVRSLDALQAKMDELKRLQAETQAELDALLPSILDRAFRGEL